MTSNGDENVSRVVLSKLTPVNKWWQHPWEKQEKGTKLELTTLDKSFQAG
ncbi:MAG: hypothetical protein SAL07_23140 [Oscillatoria sp. PMC 1051.18]|nr:hypothetical protein [Oscillatoria sp. PMC 1050.18]MEC5032808.1 hypothetical protein [Oscillatoria sp. PMC 1051.18]